MFALAAPSLVLPATPPVARGSTAVAGRAAAQRTRDAECARASTADRHLPRPVLRDRASATGTVHMRWRDEDDDLDDDELGPPFGSDTGVAAGFLWKSDALPVAAVLLAFPVAASVSSIIPNDPFGLAFYCLILALVGASVPGTLAFFGVGAIVCVVGGLGASVLGLGAQAFYWVVPLYVVCAVVSGRG